MNSLVATLAMLALLLASGCAQPPRLELGTAANHYEAGRYPEAVIAYERLVREIPQDSALWFKLANSYARAGSPEQAIDAYRNALLRSPSMGKGWYNMAEIHLQMALQSYSEGLKHVAAEDPVRQRLVEKRQNLMQLLTSDDEALGDDK